MIYLIQYDRGAGALIRMDEYPADKSGDAEKARLSLELALLEKKILHEVVLLDASSEAELRKTHRRYFETLEQMLTETPEVAS
jgi:hypothetical protein